MPTIDIPDKICPHCGGTKWFLVYQKYKDKVYTIYNCYIKRDEGNKKWMSENKDKRNFIYRKSKNKVKHTEDYIIKNRNRAKKHSCKNREEMNDKYIKSIICNSSPISYKDVPQELVELKRKQLLLKRKIKNNGKEKIN